MTKTVSGEPSALRAQRPIAATPSADGRAAAARPSTDGCTPGTRPSVRGKSLYLGEEKLTVKGVTYGPFGSETDGGFDPDTAAADFEQMAEAGINAIRVYTVPERWLLDLALEHGLLVMVGVPWEQHVAFLDSGRADAIEETVRQAVRACAGHPAILCYAIGNEIPSSIVRWHGRRRIERFLARLCRAAKQEDPEALVTYINYPSTEYLRLPSFDFLAFNVYLERRELLERYLARLQNLADDRPLLLAEVGLDSRRNGEDSQASTLQWQIETTLTTGCAGLFVFAWTDQWHRGGYDILDWDFGLTTRDREPKPALDAVRDSFAPTPHISSPAPRISVIVCTYNGAKTLRSCLEGILTLHYPNYEVIVVSDGSTDASAVIAASYEGVRVIETPQQGLAAARNSGMDAAHGEILAYIDDDAIPDPDWLSHIAAAFSSGPYAAVGGPNVLPPDSSAVAECVANAPGGPTHVLVSDREAEHIPGCNMTIRAAALREIAGFDPQFRAAGDDVDVCWRLLDCGHRIAFSPGAVVWHHRRSSIRGYLRQQRGYGTAEALLERKHPEKYSAAGHVDWAGRLYGNGAAQHRGGWRWRVYYGGWGTAFYQSIYGPRRGLLESLPLMPEWYLAIFVLGLLSVAGAFWAPLLLLALPLLGAAITALLVDASLGAARARFSSRRRQWRVRLLTGLLYLLQPLARLYGRISHGLTPWRRRGARAIGLPLPRTYSFWNEHWQRNEDHVRAVAHALRSDGSVIRSGGDWDRWDLQVRGGLLGAARLRLAVEEHGAGRQLVRVRSWPHAPGTALLLGALVGVIALIGLLSDADAVTIALGAVAAALMGRLMYECEAAGVTIKRALQRPREIEVAQADARQLGPLARPSLEAPAALPLGTLVD
jgi:GT2 family glycosyltransferase